MREAQILSSRPKVWPIGQGCAGRVAVALVSCGLAPGADSALGAGVAPDPLASDAGTWGWSPGPVWLTLEQ